MILLSEVAERLHNEVRYWTSSDESRLDVHIDAGLADVRLGNSRELSEILLIIVGLLIRPDLPMKLEIDGDNDVIFCRFSPCPAIPAGLEQKSDLWNAELSFNTADAVLSVGLKIPVAPSHYPADIHTMAVESGISIQDARLILKTMVAGARANIFTLNETCRFNDPDRCFRAAHTLKGSAKTLRAPELAAAARAVEMEARIGTISQSSIYRIGEAWNRLEHWIDSEVNAHVE